MKRRLLYFFLLLLTLSLVPGCSIIPGETAEHNSIILATSTSTQDSGLLDFLLPIYTEDTGIKVKTIAVGTGKALQMGRDGEADVLFVHYKPDELKFVEEGHGTVRYEVMYNDFVLVGPNTKPKIEYGNDIVEALQHINDQNLIFISRGDESGTHKKELTIWSEAGIKPAGDWYNEAGVGMGDVLRIADEMQGYTLTDRATYLALKDEIDLQVLVEGDKSLFNYYGVIPVNPEKGEIINADGANKFIEWLISDKAQQLISEFGIEEYGEPLFIPNYSK
ncbi:MAG: substrate-binding domain-containing protein [Dethiosulfatibacter sp.]|nr:substrate-binding domain-containing protein [Dethiosulfatibacter sp.]